MIDVTTVLALQFDGVNWIDVAGDVNSDIVAQYGISGTGPFARLADTGQIKFSLLNTAQNSGGLAGYYSPGNANCRTGFDLGCGVRLRVTYGADTFTKWQGWISNIRPSAGTYGRQATEVEATDWIGEASTAKLAQIPLQVAKRGDQLISTIVAAMTRQPTLHLDTGDETFPYAIDEAVDERTQPMEEFARIAISEMGFLYMAGGSSGSYALHFDSRSHRETDYTPLSTVSDTMSGTRVNRSLDNVKNRVIVQTHPRELTGAPVVLWESGYSIAVAAGETVEITCPYRDPALLAQRVGGKDVIPPVATTDYTMGAQTASLSVSGSYGANSTVLALTNTDSADGSVDFLRLRGTGVYDYAPQLAEASGSASIAAYGERVLAVDMTLQASQLFGRSVAEWLLPAWQTPQTMIESVDLVGHSSSALMTACLAREPGDRVHITETQTGIDSDYFIQSVKLRLDHRAGRVFTSWTLTSADMAQYWLLGVAGFSELEATTRIGF